MSGHVIMMREAETPECKIFNFVRGLSPLNKNFLSFISQRNILNYIFSFFTDQCFCS